MKPKKLDGNGDVRQFELNKRLTHAKTQVANEQAHMIRTREKTARMQLANARGDLIDKELVTKQAAFLFDHAGTRDVKYFTRLPGAEP
jgi:hypothetical protein